MSANLTVVTMWLCLSASVSDAAPTVSALLNRCAQADLECRSFLMRQEKVTRNTISLSGNWAYASGRRKLYELQDIACDGNRVKIRTWMWGDVTSTEHIEKQEDAKYLSHLWDGSQFMSYSVANRDHPGCVKIERRLEQAGKTGRQMRPDGPVPGLCGITATGERIDLLLKRMDNTHLLDEMEDINGVKCYAIEAAGKEGSYKTWIDPEHGYNIAQATSSVSIANAQSEKRIGSVKNVKFVRVGKQYVAIEADVYGRSDYANGDFMEANVHYKRSNIEINPDHDRLCSLAVDNIRNGARTWLMESMLDVEYVWRDGKVVDDAGKVILDYTIQKPAENANHTDGSEQGENCGAHT